MAGPIAIDRNDEGDIIRTVRFYTARLSKRVRTADCETLYTIYLSISLYTIDCANSFRETGAVQPWLFSQIFFEAVTKDNKRVCTRILLNDNNN